MSLPQSKFRELVFQILFRNHFLEPSDQVDSAFYMQALKTTKSNVQLAKLRVDEILKHVTDIDEKIKEISDGYDLHRIQSVELNVLRLALYEILYDNKIPGKVAISEGIRLAKKFSTQDAVPFVNGILDQVYKNKSEPVYTT